MLLELVKHNEIDSFIDEAKASGLYSIEKINIGTQNDDTVFDDYNDSFTSNESLYNESTQIELNSLLERAKKRRTKLKKETNYKWECIRDKAVPGDRTHLAESPSLVNLATFVNSDMNLMNEAVEYLAPISSWDPTKKRDFKNQTLETFNAQFNTFNTSKYGCVIQQKLSPHPSTLFSRNSTISNFESDKNLQLDNNNQVFQMIKAPHCEKLQHRTIKKQLNRIARKVLCACCVFEQVNRKTRNNFEIQTMNTDFDL